MTGIPNSRRRLMELDGETLCLRDWAKRGGMSEMTLRARLGKGMGLREAITMPVNPKYQASAERSAARRRGDWTPPEGGQPKKKWRREPTRIAWSGMLSRCNNPKHFGYRYYKDVEICERWRFYCNFLADMGERPEGTTLDRIDNSKGYHKENCRWATIHEQSRNKRSTRLITHNGITQCLTDWANAVGLNKHVLTYRLNCGWDFERAITTPKRKRSPNQEPPHA